MIKKITTLLFAILFFVQYTNAQKLEDFVSKYTGENGTKYMQPLGDVVGANLNSGFFHNADLKKLGFQMYIGVQTSLAFVSDDNKTFMGVPENELFGTTPIKTPTVFGDIDGGEAVGTGGTVYRFPGGLDIGMVPLLFPQLTVGSVFGTDLTLRFTSLNLGNDFGKLNLFGVGVRHSISQYIPLMPVNIAVGYYYQTFKIGDIVDATTGFASLQASYKLLIFTFYGGLGYETAKLDIGYQFEDGTDISYNLDGSNSVRLTTGVTFNMGPVKLNVDYNIAKQGTLNFGLGIGINEN